MLIMLFLLLSFIIGLCILHKDKDSVLGFCLALFGGLFGVFCGIVILVANCPLAQVEKRNELQEKYNAYISQIYSEAGEKNIVILSSEIAEYNAEVKTGRELQHNIWVGWFIPNFYDEMPIIETSIEVN